MWIKSFAVILLVLAVLAPFRALAEEPEIPTIYLRAGQKYPIEGVMAHSAKVEPESVASAHQTPEGILVQAQKSGTAMLSLVTGERTVRVRIIVKPAESKPQPAPRRDGLELQGLPGIKVSTLGGKTIIQGEILGRKAYQTALLHQKAFPSHVLMLALPAPGIKQSLIEQVNASLKTRGLEQVRISNAGHRFFLEGAVSSADEIDQAFEVAQGVIPNIENHLAIPIRVEPTIVLKVFILELSRHAHRALGLSWPSGTAQAAVFAPGSAAFNPTWAVSLQHLSANGQAKVLAEPSLAVKPGSSAELSAGGEIPIKLTGRFENKVIWKRYGLRVKIHVAGLAGSHVRCKIDTESSQLDDATAVDGVPGITNNSMGTEIDAVIGKPILLTGLFQASASKDVEKVPLLGDVPILGELFKSRRFREHESELLVALLPSYGAVPVKLPQESLHGLDFDFRWKVLD